MAISGTAIQVASNGFGLNAPGALTVTLSAPTVGNILIAVDVIRYGVAVVEANYQKPTGFTVIQSTFDPAVEMIVSWKVADGTETSVSSSIINGQYYVSRILTVMEFSSDGLYTSSIHASALNTTYRATSTKTISSGTASLTGYESGLAIAIAGIYEYTNWDTGRSWTNSFAEQTFKLNSTYSSGVGVASKVLTASGSVESSMVTTDSGSRSVGALIIFRPADNNVSVTPDAEEYAIGSTVQITATPPFTSPMTTMTIGDYDVISAESGATTSTANFIIPSIEQFVSGGSMANTRMNVALTATVTDGSSSAETTFKILPPSGSRYKFNTTTADYSSFVSDAKAWLDGTVIASTVSGDDILLWNTSGAIPYITSNYVISFDALPSDINLRFFDVSAGSWSAAETQSVTFGTFDGAVKDDFTDTDGTLITSHTPEWDEVGSGWVIAKEISTASAPANEVKIVNNKLKITDASEGAEIDVGSTDQNLTVYWTALQNSHALIHFRRKDDTESIVIWIRQDTGKVRMRARVNSSGINIGAEDVNKTFTEGQAYKIQVIALGNSIKMYIDDEIIYDIVLETHQTQNHTKIGLFSGLLSYLPAEYDSLEVFATEVTGTSTVSFDKTTYNANTDVTMTLTPATSEAPNSIKINGISHTFKTTPTTTGAVITLPDVSDFLTGSFNSVPWNSQVTITLGFPTISDIIGRITITGPADANQGEGSEWYGIVGDNPSGILKNLDTGSSWYGIVNSGTIRSIFTNGIVVGTNYNVTVWKYNGSNWEEDATFNFNWDKTSTTIKLDPNGNINSSNPNGEAITGELIWAEIPNYTKIEGSTFSVNLRQYLSYSGSETATTETITLSEILPDGWVLVGDTLTYSGSGTGSANIRAVASSALSNYFTVSGEEAPAPSNPDVLSPPIVSGLAATPKEGGIDVTWDRVWDIYDSEVTNGSSGVKEYQLFNGSAIITKIAETQAFPATQLSPFVIGTPATALEYEKTGGIYSLFASGNIGTAPDNYSYVGKQMSGSLKMTCRIDSIDGIQGDFTRAGIVARQTTSTGSPYYAVVLRKNKNDIALEYRTEENGSRTVATNALVPATTFPVWLQLEKTDTRWFARCSTDNGKTWIEMVSKPAVGTDWIWGIMTSTETNSPCTTTFSQVSMAYNQKITYSDTTTTTRNYKVRAVDNAGNSGDFGEVLTASPTVTGGGSGGSGGGGGGGGGGGTIEWFPGHYFWIVNEEQFNGLSHITKANYPNIRGFGIRMNFRQFEPQKDTYRIPAWIIRVLNHAIAEDQKVIIMLDFTGTSGNPAVKYPEYFFLEGNTYEWVSSLNTAYNVNNYDQKPADAKGMAYFDLGKEEVMDRIIKAYGKIGELCQGYSSFHGVIFPESATAPAFLRYINSNREIVATQLIRLRNGVRTLMPTKMINHFLNHYDAEPTKRIMAETVKSKIVHGGPDPDLYTYIYANGGTGAQQQPYPKSTRTKENAGFMTGHRTYVGFNTNRQPDPNMVDYRKFVPSGFGVQPENIGSGTSGLWVFLPSEVYDHLVLQENGPKASYIYWSIPWPIGPINRTHLYWNEDRTAGVTELSTDTYFSDWVSKQAITNFMNNPDNPTNQNRPTGY